MELGVLVATVEAETPPTVPQIGRSLGHPRQVIQRAANALLDRALISAEANPDHKRAPLLLPTPQGDDLKARIDDQLKAQLDVLLALLGRDDCVRLTQELRGVRRTLEAHLRESDPDDGRHDAE